MLKSQAISNFLSLASSEIASLYTPEMEVQVNVFKGDSTLLRDTNGEEYYQVKNVIWNPFRIPNDGEIRFDLSIHAEGIGMTGWNFQNKETYWVGFDFDSILGHKAGLSKEELQKVIAKANDLPYVSMYKSTSGKGIHIYVFFETPIPTENRKEHQALAKAVLNYLTAESGFDFNASVDCLGGILWCWHRKQEGTDGLSLIKKGNYFPVNRIPANWKQILTTKEFCRQKYSDDIESLINSSQYKILSDKQKDFLAWFPKNSKYSWWWENNICMLVCHTLDIKQAYGDLKLEGIFDTLSSGSSSQNCFCFPYKMNSWICRRYSKNVNEHSIWQTDESGWTRCFINLKTTFKQSCLYRGGNLNSSDFFLLSGKQLQKVFLDLNIYFTLPDSLENTQIKVKLKKNGILIQVDEKIKDWISNKTGGSEKVLPYYEVDLDYSEAEVFYLDDILRDCIVEGQDIGWCINISGEWIFHNRNNVINLLQSIYSDINNKSIQINMGRCIQNPWKVVNKPFKEEYPGNREWNRQSAQFAFSAEQGLCDTWFMVLEHLGKEINVNDWCKDNGINNGTDYLFFWIASMFQRPELSLPYLFFWSFNQNTGKTTLHESLKMFFKNEIGYVKANYALTSSSGFNEEMKSAVLCAIEEIDLSRNQTAYNRLKEWITASTISIRGMYKAPIMSQNTCHWIHCANDSAFCPMYKGDSRIMSIEVSNIDKEIPKYVLLEKLKLQAPAFLYRCLTLKLPLPHSRLGLPCILTQSKKDIINTKSYEDTFDAFLEIYTIPSWGDKILWTDLVNRYDMYIKSQTNGNGVYNKKRIEMLIKRHYPYIKGKDGNYIFVGNIIYSNDISSNNNFKYTCIDNKLIKKELEDGDENFIYEE